MGFVTLQDCQYFSHGPDCVSEGELAAMPFHIVEDGNKTPEFEIQQSRKI